MRIINKKYLLIILLVGVLLTGVIMFKPKEKVQLDNVILKQEVNNKTFAMYKEEGESYVPFEGTEFPEGYVLNITESKCIDNNGNELNDVLSYENGNVTITSGNTTYCYLYFNLNPLVKKLMQDKNEDTNINYIGDLWRYQGTDNVNNWICFGTKENCGNSDTNIDKYMYRIIGITGDGSLKLIKLMAVREPDNFQYKWNDKESLEDCGESGEKCMWPDSLLFKRLNGKSNGNQIGHSGDSNIFIGNDIYDYLQDSTWINMIEERLWKYGNITDNCNFNGMKMYSLESTFTSDNTILGTESKAKIGLMYLSDYLLAYKTNDDNGGNPGSRDEANKAWIFFNNDAHYSGGWEWSMTMSGICQSASCAWFMANGDMEAVPLHNYDMVRPVFYLNKNVSLTGSGTKDDPFIIETSN